MMSSIKSRLSRVTTTGLYIAEIDGLRFFAIASVFLHHLATQLQDHGFSNVSSPVDLAAERFASVGNFGVLLFFVISGFILGIPFSRALNKAPYTFQYKNYFLRRLTRLEPPYIVNLIGCFLLYCIADKRFDSELLPNLAASLTYTHNLVYHRMSAINYVAWSLEVEAQFYLLLPAYIWLLSRLPSLKARRYAIWTSILLLTVIQPRLAEYSAAIDILHYGHFFLLGLLMADITTNEWQGALRKQKWGDAWLFVALGALALASSSGFKGSFWTTSVIGVSLFLAGTLGPQFSTICRAGWLPTIGGMCYTIYLYHSKILTLLWPSTARLRVGDSFALNLAVRFVLEGFIVLAMCAMLFLAIEKPFMNPKLVYELRDRLFQKKTGELSAVIEP